MATECVLLVETEEPIRVLTRMLLQHAGYRVLEARSGEEVIRLARQESPCAIVLEASLAPVSGRSPVEVLKTDPQTAAIPVIVTDAPDSTGATRTGFTGGDAYLGRPCTARSILNEVERLALPRAHA